MHVIISLKALKLIKRLHCLYKISFKEILEIAWGVFNAS